MFYSDKKEETRNLLGRGKSFVGNKYFIGDTVPYDRPSEQRLPEQPMAYMLIYAWICRIEVVQEKPSGSLYTNMVCVAIVGVPPAGIPITMSDLSSIGHSENVCVSGIITDLLQLVKALK